MGDPDTATLGVPEEDGRSAAREGQEPFFLPGEIAAGRFHVIGLLGEGGMSQVFEAEDLELGQRVAIKVIPISPIV